MLKKMIIIVLSMTFVLVAQESQAGFGDFKRSFNKGVSGLGKAVSNNKGLIGGAALVVILGPRLGDNAILGIAAGALIGHVIDKHLRKPDRSKMARSTQTAVVTGESSEWSNEKSGTKGGVIVKERKVESKQEKVKVLKDQVETVPPLELNVGGQYSVTAAANVRSGPGEEYKQLSELKKDDTIDVIGKVEGQPWYMVSSKGVGIGYVDPQHLKLTGVPVDTGKPSAKAKQQIAEVEVPVKQTCTIMQQWVPSKSGEIVSEQVIKCQQPNGSWS